ncbi:hypothetical protein D0865_04335 [Hortaea werneckii]|uniref:Glucose-methanol-choline oxidoreductase N-terminal domain-containing protein n=1 Tax=Hortaea werneckii TaxID=91943 RepID=A0A3M7CSQ8_HORWE|nr:hypothetical protein D0865_04335 [Hortaea werneckii]
MEARGKTLDGSSAFNYMAYHRAINGSYDKWAHDVGDSSYSFEQLIPYNERSANVTFPSNDTRVENATVNFDRGAYNEDASQAQPLHVSWSGYAGVFSTSFSHAFQALALRASNLFDPGSLYGANYALSTIDPDVAKRDSSQTSFLNYAMPDIIVYPHTLARKILLGNDSSAEGVAITTSGVNYTLTAQKEVILSAGGFHSPQLLRLSGIGPADQLKQHNIPVVKDLAGGGQNMWDQIFFGVAHPVSFRPRLDSRLIRSTPQRRWRCTKPTGLVLWPVQPAWDTSTFPFLPPGHPQSTVYMLAEKFADDIKQGRRSGNHT